MKQIFCPECGHPINEHDHNGCWHEQFTQLMCLDCNQTPESIAAHAIEAAGAEARKLLTPFAVEGKEWMGAWNQADNNDIPIIKWKLEDDDDNSFALFTVGDLRRAAAWLASHPAPEDMRTVAERDLDEWQKEVMDTRETDRPQ